MAIRISGMRASALVAAGALTLAACGDSGGSDQGVISSTDEPAAAQPVDEATSSTTAGAPSSTAAGEDATATGLTFASGWSSVTIGEGTKPVLALDATDQPGVAFLFEDVPEGFVAFASAADGWAIDQLVEGYFYGPIGLDYGPDGTPHIAYHDHQASQFRQELGDLTVASFGNDGWQITAAESEGHDGWDSTIRVGADGVLRAAGVDPSQFGRVEGLEYYEFVDGAWSVEAIGTGPLEYEWNVDLQVNPDGEPGLSYFQSDDADLVFASRSGGVWTTEVVDADGDVGRFSSFAFDADGAAHIAYWHGETGAVRYATNSAGSWDTQTIGSLSAVQVGFEGARRITSLALSPDGGVRIAYSDVTGIWLARQSNGEWVTEQVVQAAEKPLGQLVSLAVDSAGASHLAFFEVTANGPLSGIVTYATSG